MINKEKITYNLYSTERIYRQNTLISYYFQRNRKLVKKCSPIDINGERFRQNHETGEITNYTKKDILNSYQASLRRTIILMNELLAMNDFDWFWTLTFDSAKIDRTNAQAVFNCYKKYINNIKKQYPQFGYMTFPEQHEDGCFHFHLLTNGLTPKQMGLVNSGKVCCHWAKKKYNGIMSKEHFEKTKQFHELKETDGETIYNATSFAYGFTTVSRIVSRERCNSYVKKYVEKALGSTEVFKKRFYYSSNLNKPDTIKKLIKAEYNDIYDIEELKCIKNNALVKNAKYKNKNDYNVMQIKIDNETKHFIDLGLIPLLFEETKKIEKIFNENKD